MRRCTKTPALLSPFSISLHSSLSSPPRPYHPAAAAAAAVAATPPPAAAAAAAAATVTRQHYHNHDIAISTSLQGTLLPTSVLRRVARW